jgi:hypothetical protein
MLTVDWGFKLPKALFNRPKSQCKRKALSTMHYVYTAAVGRTVIGKFLKLQEERNYKKCRQEIFIVEKMKV